MISWFFPMVLNRLSVSATLVTPPKAYSVSTEVRTLSCTAPRTWWKIQMTTNSKPHWCPPTWLSANRIIRKMIWTWIKNKCEELDLPLSAVRHVYYDLLIHISQLSPKDSANRLHTIIYSRARMQDGSEFSQKCHRVPLHSPKSSRRWRPSTEYEQLWLAAPHKRTKYHGWAPRKSVIKSQWWRPMSRRFWLFSAKNGRKCRIVDLDSTGMNRGC